MSYLSVRPHRCRDTTVFSRLKDIKENTKVVADNSNAVRSERQIWRGLCRLHYGYDNDIVVVGLSESQVMSRVHRPESLTTVQMYCQFCPKCPKGTSTPALSTTTSTRTSNSIKPKTISPTSSIRLNTRSTIFCKPTLTLECSIVLELPERGSIPPATHLALNYYQHYPLSYLDEAQDAFRRAHDTEISKTSVWRTHSLGRRAIHIKGLYVFGFVEELSHINWSHQNLVFLDEVSFDNRGMIDKRGYAIRGKAIRHPWRLREKSPGIDPGVNGIIDYFNTERTFDRLEFTKYCQNLVHAEKGLIRQYSGRIQSGSWMELPYTGTLNYSLSTKCPRRGYLLAGILSVFYRIEFFFGYVKHCFQLHNSEANGRDLTPFVA
ncbi:Hypothetical protein PHPALM_6339 [Phytophthora palmivora]|uniref:Uncharacterized protein n=1 Tax=Phytophthora palmivora TaxID=4796 RepID=A0A2P4YFF2_9STRA|nr:Hypothetical protein PHPALM_6339 [Phytophthora palmivora]